MKLAKREKTVAWIDEMLFYYTFASILRGKFYCHFHSAFIKKHTAKESEEPREKVIGSVVVRRVMTKVKMKNFCKRAVEKIVQRGGKFQTTMSQVHENLRQKCHKLSTSQFTFRLKEKVCACKHERKRELNKFLKHTFSTLLWPMLPLHSKPPQLKKATLTANRSIVHCRAFVL